MAHRVEHHPLDAAFAALLANGLDGADSNSCTGIGSAPGLERMPNTANFGIPDRRPEHPDTFPHS